MRAFIAVLSRELRLAARQRAEWAQPLLFYAIVATLFALGAAPNAPWLKLAAPSVLWVGALLAALLSLDRMFRGDYEDGTLEQFFLTGQPASLLIAAKLLAHCLLIALPLTLLAPVLAVIFGLPAPATGVLTLSLLLGLPAMVLLAGFVSALTVGLPRAGLLLPVLVLPLICPVVIFGAGAVRAAQTGLPAEAPLYFLAAILVLCLCAVPLAAAAALRNALE
jgi:heme exporter protein B